jgi:tetratricopeptide (TPR) repeat protein
MLSRYSVKLILIALGFSALGCASHSLAPTYSSGGGAYYESSLSNRNRAPASMAPPSYVADSVDTLDPIYMRTQADFYFSMGEAQSLDGQHQKAIESFKMVLVYDSKSAPVHLRISAEYVKQGMISQALEYAETAVKLDSKYVDGRLLLGGLYSSLKVYKKAIHEYEEALKLDPKNTEAPMYIGAVYAEQKQYEKAVRYFERLAKNDDYGTPYLAWYYVGRIRAEQGGKANEATAEVAFKKAMSLKPDHFESLLALGQLYSKKNQDAKALEIYRKFQREQAPNPKLAELLSQIYLEQEKYDLAYEQFEILEQYSDDTLNAKVKMALVLIEQKKYEPAIAKLKEVLKQVPDSDKIRFYLAAIYEETERWPEAIDSFEKIPADSQYYGEAMVHATYLLKQAKKNDEAIALIKKATAQRQDVAQFYAIHASMLDEAKDYKKAAEVLEEGIKKFPDNVQLKFFLGTVNDHLGNRRDVIANMKEVIDLDPNHVQGLNYLAFTYAESNKNLDEAEILVRRALEIEPNDGFVLDTLGWILYKAGKWSDSIKVLEAAHKSQPNESIISEHLGDAYHKHQLVEKARRMYQRAVETESDESKVRHLREKITAIDKQDLARPANRLPASAK